MEQENDPPVEGPDAETTPEHEERAMRRRRALQRLGKIAIYTTPLVVGLLSSDAWSESG